MARKDGETFPTTDPTAVLPAGHARPGRWGRWVQRRIDYPYAEDPYHPTDRLDLAKGMRSLMAAFILMILVLMGGIVAAVFTQTAIPSWVSTGALPLCMALGVGLGTPQARHASASMLCWGLRSQLVEQWLDAEVPFTRIWTMAASPITPQQFAQYAEALKALGWAGLDGGVDPRVVWAAHERNLAPTAFLDYARLGFSTPEQAIAAAGCGISPDQWEPFVELVPRWRDRPDLAFKVINWLRSTNAHRHPAEFRAMSRAGLEYGATSTATVAGSETATSPSGPTAPTPLADLDTTLAVLRDWVHPQALSAPHWGREVPCPYSQHSVSPKGMRHTCHVCGSSTLAPGTDDRLLHDAAPFYAMIGDDTIKEWGEQIGSLAPWFIRAGFSRFEAARTVREDPPDVETLKVMAALRFIP